MVREMTPISGSCHCGNIRLSLLWPGPPAEIPIRKCSCSFCRKRNGSWTSSPAAALTVVIDDSSLITKYRFGTGSADFYICARCGVVPFVLSQMDGASYAVVNVHTLDDIETGSLPAVATNFDGENTATRLERRRRNWIPDVKINSEPQ